MKQYKVTGMSCAACSARVEKAVSSVDGVKSCNVNLLTATLSVEGEASDKDIVLSVKNAGYGIADDNTVKEESETKKLVKRLVSSAVFLLLLMYISMGSSVPLIATRSIKTDWYFLCLQESWSL